MAHRVFVDGQTGTTGLEINERLAARGDVRVQVIPEAERKDPRARARYLNGADVVFLCLPDDAAREAVALVTDPAVRVIDASTAHRTSPDWAYGLPELSPGHRARVAASRRVSVPGCHATGFLLLVHPLVRAGLLPADYPVVCYSLTGHSGGGKKMIEDYRAPAAPGRHLESPRHYALALEHKHLPEMRLHAGLVEPPLFAPVVGSFYRGMAVSVPLVSRTLASRPRPDDVHRILAAHYAGARFVRVVGLGDQGYLDQGFLNPMGCNGTNVAELSVHGNDGQILLVARLDNLGKGASGAAVQCMNLMLGLDEGLGLEG